MECAVISWLNVVVLAGTLAAIVWYSVETRRLRKETEKLRRETARQTELQIRPLVTVRYYGNSLLISNLGKGPARDICVLDTELPGTDFGPPSQNIPIARFKPVEHLLVEGDSGLEGEILRLGPSGDPVSSDDPQLPADKARALFISQFGPSALLPRKVVVRYSNLVGKRYETTITITEGFSRVVSDERLD